MHTFCFVRYAYFLSAHANTVIQSYLYNIEDIAVADELMGKKNRFKAIFHN